MTPFKFTIECVAVAAFFYGICYILPLAYDIVSTL